MSRKLIGAAFAALVLGAAPLAHAAYTTVDLSPYVNQGFVTNGWYIDGFAPYFDLAGKTTVGNQGVNVPFAVANVNDPNVGPLNFWFGNDDGSHQNLFGPKGSVTIAVNDPSATTVHTLVDNVFGNYFADEFDVIFHGTAGDLAFSYIGGVDTRDYNTPNCATTGCTGILTAQNWYNFAGIVLDTQTFHLPTGFGLQSITFNQVNDTDGVILAGVTLGAPEPATWALMISGFGLAGAALRRRKTLAA